MGTIPSPCVPHSGRGIVCDLFVSAHEQEQVMIFCTIKSKPLALPWGRTPRLDSGVRVSIYLSLSSSKMANKHSIMTREMVESFCNSYYIPDEVHPTAPGRDRTITQFPEGKVGVYTRLFDYCGYRIPLTKFFVAVLKHFRIHISQLSPFGAARVSHFEVLTRVLNLAPSVAVFRAFYTRIYSDGLFSFAKRSLSAPSCLSKPPDSIKNWADHFFWVDSKVFPISVPLYMGGGDRRRLQLPPHLISVVKSRPIQRLLTPEGAGEMVQKGKSKYKKVVSVESRPDVSLSLPSAERQSPQLPGLWKVTCKFEIGLSGGFPIAVGAFLLRFSADFHAKVYQCKLPCLRMPPLYNWLLTQVTSSMGAAQICPLVGEYPLSFADERLGTDLKRDKDRTSAVTAQAGEKRVSRYVGAIRDSHTNTDKTRSQPGRSTPTLSDRSVRLTIRKAASKRDCPETGSLEEQSGVYRFRLSSSSLDVSTSSVKRVYSTSTQMTLAAASGDTHYPRSRHMSTLDNDRLSAARGGGVAESVRGVEQVCAWRLRSGIIIGWVGGSRGDIQGRSLNRWTSLARTCSMGWAGGRVVEVVTVYVSQVRNAACGEREMIS
ncbi:hypothetical protein Tco_0907043 [Tanacetum coccineum]|uniref:Transposase (putative) gypsy type domain-containing protein n=1 Tax=Tanacetum coccineum TaxID=301880 RepID=A0ABQ5CJ40_9ASTR